MGIEEPRDDNMTYDEMLAFFENEIADETWGLVQVSDRTYIGTTYKLVKPQLYDSEKPEDTFDQGDLES